MSYTIQHLDLHNPTLLCQLTGPVDAAAEAGHLLHDIEASLAEVVGQRVCLIIDLSTADLSLRDVVLAVTSINLSYEETGALRIFDARMQTIFVDSSAAMGLVVESLQLRAGDPLRVRRCDTLTEAQALASGAASVAQRGSLEGGELPCAIVRGDLPAPVVRYKLTPATILQRKWEQMALDIVTMLAGIEGEAAYLIIEAPKMDITLAEMTAVLSETSKPHGGSEISRRFHAMPVTLSTGESNLHVMISGLRHGQYGDQYREMFKVINLAMEQINQAWAVIRALKGPFGVQMPGFVSTAKHQSN